MRPDGSTGPVRHHSHFGSYEWRKLLNKLGFRDIHHHGLRSRSATIAKRNKLDGTYAMGFLNHTSPAVHRLYQKLVPVDAVSALDDLADKLGYDQRPIFRNIISMCSSGGGPPDSARDRNQAFRCPVVVRLPNSNL